MHSEAGGQGSAADVNDDSGVGTPLQSLAEPATVIRCITRRSLAMS